MSKRPEGSETERGARLYGSRGAPVPDVDVTGLLHAWREGDREAFERLLPLVYDELRRRARAYLRNERSGITLETRDLVHEVYFRFVECREPWEGRSHFFAVIAKKMREFLVDHARARKAQKRGGGMAVTGLTGHDRAEETPYSVLALHDALGDLERFDSRKAHMLEMRYFGGMSNLDIAGCLEVSESTVERELRLARAWLASELTPASAAAPSAAVPSAAPPGPGAAKGGEPG